jgi:hypothetical protein
VMAALTVRQAVVTTEVVQREQRGCAAVPLHGRRAPLAPCDLPEGGGHLGASHRQGVHRR